jgi:hypothetical protein
VSGKVGRAAAAARFARLGEHAPLVRALTRRYVQPAARGRPSCV